MFTFSKFRCAVIFLAIFFILACSAPAIRAEPIDFRDQNSYLYTTSGGSHVYWYLNNFLSPLSKIIVNGDNVNFQNYKSSLGDTYESEIEISPSSDPVFVDLKKIDLNGATVFEADITDSSSQSVDLTMTGLNADTTYYLFEDGSEIKSSTSDSAGTLNFTISDVSSTYEIKTEEEPTEPPGKTFPPFNPIEKELDIDLKVGRYKGGGPEEGGEIKFIPDKDFRQGEKVTVVAYLSVNGVEMSHGEVTGDWNGQSFVLEDKYANKFERHFTVSEDTSPGTYIVTVDASAQNLQSTASDSITVTEVEGIDLMEIIKDYWFIIAIIGVFLFLLALEEESSG